jgi:hypothetical protein
MGRNIVITEEQMACLNEGDKMVQQSIDMGPAIAAAKGDINQAKKTIQTDLQTSGQDPKKFKGSMGLGDSKIYTKAQIIENRLNNLRKNSTVYTVKEFLKTIGK